MLNSQYQPLCAVMLPFKSRQKYMHTFDLANPVMAEGFEDYLEPVQRLCTAAGAYVGIAHMTVDEKIVEAGMSQRKPRPHIDGRFMPEKMRWGGGGWNHHCNEIPQRMPIIVAASVAGCRVWRGRIDGSPNEHGGCEHLIDQLDAGEIVPANVGYLLSGDCIHESMVFDHQVKRTFLRIALPIDFVAPPQS